MKNGLIYGLEDRPPLKDTLFAALQHLLAIFVALITPPLIISGALGLDITTTSYLVWNIFSTNEGSPRSSSFYSFRRWVRQVPL